MACQPLGGWLFAGVARRLGEFTVIEPDTLVRSEEACPPGRRPFCVHSPEGFGRFSASDWPLLGEVYM